MRRRLCAGHEDGGPVWQTGGIRNSVALRSSLNPVVLQLVKRFSFYKRFVIRADYGLSIGHRSVLVPRSMDDTYENMPCLGLNRRRTYTPSRFDDVGADVRLGGRFADLADEDVNPTKGDPVPVFN